MSTGFEPAILAIKQILTYALDRMATKIGLANYRVWLITCSVL